MSSHKSGAAKPPSNGNGKGNGHAAGPLPAESASPAAPKPGPPAGRQVKCPICGKPAAWDHNPSRPFCSERCRLMDLGQWADGTYAIPAEKVPDKGEDEE